MSWTIFPSMPASYKYAFLLNLLNLTRMSLQGYKKEHIYLILIRIKQ